MLKSKPLRLCNLVSGPVNLNLYCNQNIKNYFFATNLRSKRAFSLYFFLKKDLETRFQIMKNNSRKFWLPSCNVDDTIKFTRSGHATIRS